MTLVRFEPMRDLDHITNSFQRLFGEFPGFQINPIDGFNPRIDISENSKSIIVEAEIPGVSKDDLKLTLEDNILTLEGEKKKVDEDKDTNYYREERVYGSFKRSFTLPVEVNPDKVDAKFENGMLRVEMKKAEPKKEKEKVIKLK